MSRLLDANAVLRYLLNDVPEQAEEVREAVLGSAWTTPDIISECVYVLSGRVYGFPREEVSLALLDALDSIDCEHIKVVRRALALFGSHGLDFSDCLLAARAELEGAEVLTFDKKLARLIGELKR